MSNPQFPQGFPQKNTKKTVELSDLPQNGRVFHKNINSLWKTFCGKKNRVNLHKRRRIGGFLRLWKEKFGGKNYSKNE